MLCTNFWVRECLLLSMVASAFTLSSSSMEAGEYKLPWVRGPGGLPYKTMSLNNNNKNKHRQKGLGAVEHIFNPNTGKAEAGESMWVPDQPGQNSDTSAVHVYVYLHIHTHMKQKFKSVSSHPSNVPVKEISITGSSNSSISSHKVLGSVPSSVQNSRCVHAHTHTIIHVYF